MQALSRNTDNGEGSFVKPTADARAPLPEKLHGTEQHRLSLALVIAADHGLSTSEAAKVMETTRKAIQSVSRLLIRKGLCFKAGSGAAIRMYATRHYAENNTIRTTEQWTADLFLDALRTAGSQGLSTPELFALADCHQRTKEKAMQQLREKGLAFHGGKNNSWRNFATKEDAERYVVWRAERRIQLKREADRRKKAAHKARNPSPSKPPKPPEMAKAVSPKPVKAPAPKPEPKPGKLLVSPPRGKRQEQTVNQTAPIIIPESVTVQRIPRVPDRFEVSGPVTGGFATMRPGHYLPDNTWAARALEGRR